MLSCLTVEFPRQWGDNNGGTTSLFAAMGHFHALSELRIRLPRNSDLRERTNDVLRSVRQTHHDYCWRADDAIHRGNHFQLHTLYCDDNLDIPGIIDVQLKLQLLGLYTQGGDHDVLKNLKYIYGAASASTLPAVFALERESFKPTFDHISIFPTLYPETPTICQALVDSFNRDIGIGMYTEKEEVSYVSIFLNDFADTGLLCSIMKDMTVCFPKVTWLILSVDRPSQTVSPEPPQLEMATNHQI
jgi:hypothetical protein